MTVEEYAIDLIASGTESLAEDDLNEDGEIADELHDEACGLAIDAAHAIKANPQAFMAWFNAIRPAKGDPR